MKLVICEKPSVGAAVAAALGVREKKDGYIEGNGYVISWCIGHLLSVPLIGLIFVTAIFPQAPPLFLLCPLGRRCLYCSHALQSD